ncbi:MAG: MFS transporter [Clostridia bacterium]|nr:MFS transporter [Clostridia bacterium]
MVALLLAIIYLSFISLGLPDSLLGSAWPTMVTDLDTSLSYAGLISMIIAFGTIVSSLLSDKITRKLGTGLVTAISVLTTAVALLGFSFSNSLLMICLFAIPYGLGAGAVDAALNNYVALHFASRHMSWLHCFWGIGATISPYIMGYAISSDRGWQSGYGIVSVIQLALTVCLFASLPLWKKKSTANVGDENYEAPIGLRDALKIKGVKQILVAFLCFCAFEVTTGLWASSYLAEYRGVDAEIAANFGSLFYMGITLGRFACGFFADKVGDKNLIRGGIAVMLAGIAMIILPVKADIFALVGLVITGVGSAPVYPSIIHSTPNNFGKENSHAIVGIQMASAYTGSALMPPLFGLIADYISISLYPFFIAFFVIMLLFMTEFVNKAVKKQS